MKGDAKPLVQFMDGADKRFIIPVYQRNYDWKEEQCKQLYDDLVKLVVKNRKNHFFGSIVSVHDPDGYSQEYLIIDGQQRLTTVSLLLLAMFNLLNQGTIKTEKANIAQKIYEEYLVDKFQPAEKRIKLKPIKNDQDAFSRLFGDEEDFVQSSNVTQNYRYFSNRILRQEITADQLYHAISRLFIIDISLSQDDNPQLIFESLNSTGLDLSEGDKIRNYILMGLSTDRQEKYYTKFWHPIEIKTDFDVSTFIRDYLSIKQQQTPNIRRTYFSFKEYVEGLLDPNLDDLLSDLLAYAKRYEYLSKPKSINYLLTSCIRRLNRLDITVIRPFLLEILRIHEEGKLTENEMTEVFRVVENYLFRRSICDLPTNSLNKIFLLLHKDVVKLNGSSESRYVEKLKYILCSKRERARFPEDNEFAAALAQRDIYAMQPRNRGYLFERFENGDSREDKDIYGRVDDGTYTVEHIMPQHLTTDWRDALGEEYESIHSTWLHRLANLTLSAYNSKYSNRSFQEKRDMTDGFRESGFRLSLPLVQLDQWTLPEIENRSKTLVQHALTLWPYVNTAYVPSQIQLEECTLDDDVNLTGTQIMKFYFMGKEFGAPNWTDMYQKVVAQLHEGDKVVLNRLADNSDNEDGLKAYVSRTAEQFLQSYPLEDKLFLQTHASTATKVTLLRKFFKLFNTDPNDLIFYFKQGEAIEDYSDDLDIRYRYWTSLLPMLRVATGLFLNVNPNRSSWISCTTGYAGVSFSCIVTKTYSSTELSIGTADQSRNKAIYDRLIEKKQDVEERFGGTLFWERMDQKIMSRISVRIENVSIAAETDWENMRTFHCDSCKRLVKAIMPLLESFMPL